MKEYIAKLNAFLKPHKAVECERVITYWVDNQTYYFLDYSTLPWVYGLNNRGDKIEIKQFMDIQLAKTSVALYLKGVLFDNRLDRLGYNCYNCKFKSLSEVKDRLKKNKLEDYYSINIFSPNKINLTIKNGQKNIYFTTINNQKILLSKNSEYILDDFYKAVVDLYIRILDFNDYKKIYNDDIKWKTFYEIYGYIKKVKLVNHLSNNNKITLIKEIIELLNDKINKTMNNDNLKFIESKYETALSDLCDNKLISVDLTQMSRLYLESYSDYMNPVLSKMSELDDLIYSDKKFVR